MDLAEIFEPTELDAAERIFDAVPDDIGKSPYAEARLSGIINKAYSYKLRGIIPNKRSEFEKRILDYCERHKLMERMKEAGLIDADAFYLGSPLWRKVKEKSSD